ncbi:L-aspartate oxidase [Brachybacterium saurashtrense]|uniref:L-aspartate oxidase n=1 Tax=Brachybacterium saurashtrense TaxID=556288 RepID=A0A345YSQ7_9MICO|nr:L-aspartate oxidase [Brachybacterium saurashtrense]AXK46959.1 L-aspartate oxidase [Brachybacterium saurashtrense]RRR22674.1 L-aspartate oxidase [Brachybacterium saurashtrense]
MPAQERRETTAQDEALPAEPLRTDVLVIGSGIAGLTAALRAARSATVLLVTKAALADGATARAQGGIAGAVDAADTPADHARDTLDAGAGLGDPEAVRRLCEAAPAAIAALEAHGVRFDRAPGGGPALGLEGAHGRPRILHAGGDATGAAIQDALVAAVRARAAVEDSPLTLREHTALVDLDMVDGRAVGAALRAADGSRLAVRAGAVLLATGGAGQLFTHTTNPATATGDGLAAAWRAGAALEDLEFYQFHPTALAVDGPEACFLLSEAVRGEGALLRDEHGHRFLPAIDPRGELAPRDVVARAIAQVMVAQEGRPVLLDATALGAEHLRRRFPTIDAALRRAGIDWSRTPVPVTPAAHYWMGGIRTDLEGRTTVPGLFAAGECARTGVHGANRLASNSLLEGAVFGERAGEAAAAAARAGSELPAPAPSPGRAPAPAPSAAASSAPASSAAAPSTATPPAATAPSAAPARGGRDWSRAALQALLWRHVGPLRHRAGLEEAAAQLAAWQAPPPAATTSLAALEDRNLLDLARLLTAHALARPDSVGAHHLLDAPAPRDAPAPADAPHRTTAPQPALVPEASAC